MTARPAVCLGPWLSCFSCRTAVKYGYTCDWPLIGPKAGQKCDALVCSRCRHERQPRPDVNIDLCPAHARRFDNGTPVPPTRKPTRVFTACLSGISNEGLHRWAQVPETDAHIGVKDDVAIIAKHRGRLMPVPMNFATVLWSPRPRGAAPLYQGPRHVCAEDFTQAMREVWETDQQTWNLLLSRDKIWIACYCLVPADCRRTTLAEILVKLGAIYEGERNFPQED